MRKHCARLTAFTVTVALGLFQPVAAQDSGTLIHRYKAVRIPDDIKNPADRGWYTLVSYTSCLVAARPGRVTALLKMPIGDKSYNELLAKSTDGDCLYNGEMRFAPSLFRGAFYTALFRRDYRQKQPPLSESRIDFAKDTVDPAEREATLHIVMLQFADCVVRKDVDNARTLVLAQTGSAREAAALTALSPKLGPCMPEHLSVSFSKPMLEGYFAEALYRDSTPAS